MAENDIKSSKSDAIEWTSDTCDYYTLRLDGVRSTIVAVSINVSDYPKGDGRSTDEVIALTLQCVHDELRKLEQRSYETDHSGMVSEVTDLSLKLMWARAMMEVLIDSICADTFKVNIGDFPFLGHLAAVARLTEDAEVAANAVHQAKFRRAESVLAN